VLGEHPFLTIKGPSYFIVIIVSLPFRVEIIALIVNIVPSKVEVIASTVLFELMTLS
jgi:hypothetical protein